MQESQQEFDDFDAGGDDLIEEFLASEDPALQDLGLECLNARYGGPYSGVLKRLCSERGWQLQSEDIADVWQDTMFEIWVNVKRGRFSKTGRLDGYVYTIFKCRATDFFRGWRARISRNREVSVDLDNLVSGDEPKETRKIEVEWLLSYYIEALSEIKHLSKREQLVIKHYVSLLLSNNKFPSPNELTNSVNIERFSNQEGKLEEEAVKSAKARAIRKLRN